MGAERGGGGLRCPGGANHTSKTFGQGRLRNEDFTCIINTSSTPAWERDASLHHLCAVVYNSPDHTHTHTALLLGYPELPSKNYDMWAAACACIFGPCVFICGNKRQTFSEPGPAGCVCVCVPTDGGSASKPQVVRHEWSSPAMTERV